MLRHLINNNYCYHYLCIVTDCILVPFALMINCFPGIRREGEWEALDVKGKGREKSDKWLLIRQVIKVIKLLRRSIARTKEQKSVGSSRCDN